jgi:uncharacterized membrane protein YeaQ/YmgE (transglycosylase-associated protein family)
MGIISWAIWGLFVGLIARAVMPGRQPIGIVWTILLGVAGALIGGFVATEILDIADNDEFDFGSFLIAVATSVGLLLLYLRYFADREREPRYGSADR